MEKLTGSIQENLLVLLCWSDTSFQLVRDSVDAKLFTTAVYRDIVAQVYDYIDQFKKPPKAHLSDLLEDTLTDESNKSADLYRQVVKAVMRSRKQMNEKYILKQLEKFVRIQNLKIGLIAASNSVTEGDADAAELAMEKAMKSRLSLFTPGTTLREALSKLERKENLREPLPLGIPDFDRHGLGPARKELHTFIGPKKGGKTWWLIHLAKRAALYGWKVAVVTLEVSEDLYAIRTLQSFFSLTVRQAAEAGQRQLVTRFEKDQLGRIIGANKDYLKRLSLHTDEGVKFAKNRMAKFKAADRIRIKEFPTGMLTISGLKAYLDSLERFDGFVPDILLLDYVMLMKMDSKNLRTELGEAAKQLRGIAVERNMAVATVTQSNREGVKSGTTKDTDVGEDFSIVPTSDIVFAYSQTEAEYTLGLSRLHVTASRISRQNLRVMLSQNYDIGQFCLDSGPVMSEYWDTVKSMSGEGNINLNNEED